MTTDLRGIVRVAYLRMFLYTVVTSFVLVSGTGIVYDLLEGVIYSWAGVSLYEVVPVEVEMGLFGVIALTPIINCARLVFIGRISGRTPVELFSRRSLFRAQGAELAVLVMLVPFLSREIFAATGLSNVIGNVVSAVNSVFGAGTLETNRVRDVATIGAVLYLYPSIILVYLSHSRLTKLYPFTQFISVARSWNYVLLVVTTFPVVLVLSSFILQAIEVGSSESQLFLVVLLREPIFASISVTLTTVTFLFVFVRLGTMVVEDQKLRATFTGEVDKEIQTTLSEFS